MLHEDTGIKNLLTKMITDRVSSNENQIDRVSSDENENNDRSSLFILRDYCNKYECDTGLRMHS